MSIQEQAKDTIQIWSVTHTRDNEGAYQRSYTYVSSPKVMWLWDESVIDTTQKQENLGTSAKILTDNETVFNQLEERGTIVMFNGKKYQVNSLKNTANKGKAFKILVSESNIKDTNFVGGLSGGGKGALSQV